MLNLLVLCGTPGSGKTTLARKILKDYDYDFHSFDDLGCNTHRDLILPIKESLKNGHDVIVDSTYSRKKIRMELLESIHDLECRKIIYYLPTPLDLCISRNAERGYTVSTDTLQGIYYSFQSPVLEEGWDEIIILRSDSNDKVYPNK